MDACLEFKLSGEAGNSLELGSLTDVLPKADPGTDTKNKRTNARAQGISPLGSIPPQISAQEAGLFSVKTAAGGESVYGERKHLVIPNNAFILEIISHPEGV